MFQQIKLPYAYDALEPHIDALTMETHYSKHHAAYTKNLNDAAQKAGVADKEITSLLSSLENISDEALRKAIRNNGGGFYNHNLYFSTMSPDGGGQPTGLLKDELEKAFGSFTDFQNQLSSLAAGQFGSGWGWLSANRDGRLILSASANQDNPLMEGKGFVPILGIDVWEHAYYLKYKNLRADYIKAFFHVIDWKAVSSNYENIRKG
ncbi:superoxide dismutase [Lacrimispora saccharolytica]|uniref:Superoxide dismutase n=1 Tax=Lacrimispora saccharolytica (strain ATCC 35040 / DSM 2544 / NRCC 2533 / WM1) TaxID=610130 RepID=D9QZT1_LACSW|nr:superoxide dismutase [Lacrimispora saccharolytica]ADL06307.1 Manganese/iron superoxide dismutase-like protein [[Clostridium] saccharolyticum WM1]QRV19592.1 superoxide dismutase [Lacrimispora saccharolytica]